jgi:hypothetical protein
MTTNRNQELLETITLTANDLAGNIRYIEDLICKLKLDISHTLGAIERAVGVCAGEADSITSTNQQLTTNLTANLAKGV